MILLGETLLCRYRYDPLDRLAAQNGLLGLLGFNGERRDAVTGHYLLGNGYRGFNPVLMRFNSPDSFSPFGKGGLNAYAYCLSDPVNASDPTGHGLKALLRIATRGKFKLEPKTAANVASPTALVGKYKRQSFLQSKASSSYIEPVPAAKPAAAVKVQGVEQLYTTINRRNAVINLQALHLEKLGSVSNKLVAELNTLEIEISRLSHPPYLPPPPYQQAAKIRSSTAGR